MQYEKIKGETHLEEVINDLQNKLYTSHAEGIYLYISREMLLKKPKVLIRAMILRNQLYYAKTAKK